MIWRGHELKELTVSQLGEAVDMNNRMADIAMAEGMGTAIFAAWHQKALELHAEGVRRGLLDMNGEAHG